jgi:hypothetical protein
MTGNKTFPLGGIVMIEKVEKEFGLFSNLFYGIGGDAKDFIPIVKYLVNNKLTFSVSVNQLLNTYPAELAMQLGMKQEPGERTLYRTLERVGKCSPILVDRYQHLIERHNL